MSKPVVNHEVILIGGLHRLLALFPHSFKQLEHYTFYGLVATIPKEVPILGAETRVYPNTMQLRG